MKNEEVGDES